MTSIPPPRSSALFAPAGAPRTAPRPGLRCVCTVASLARGGQNQWTDASALWPQGRQSPEDPVVRQPCVSAPRRPRWLTLLALCPVLLLCSLVPHSQNCLWQALPPEAQAEELVAHWGACTLGSWTFRTMTRILTLLVVSSNFR